MYVPGLPLLPGTTATTNVTINMSVQRANGNPPIKLSPVTQPLGQVFGLDGGKWPADANMLVFSVTLPGQPSPFVIEYPISSPFLPGNANVLNLSQLVWGVLPPLAPGLPPSGNYVPPSKPEKREMPTWAVALLVIFILSAVLLLGWATLNWYRYGRALVVAPPVGENAHLIGPSSQSTLSGRSFSSEGSAPDLYDF